MVHKMAQPKKDKSDLIENGKTIRMQTFFRPAIYKLILEDMQNMFIENDATWLRMAAKEFLRNKKKLL